MGFVFDLLLKSAKLIVLCVNKNSYFLTAYIFYGALHLLILTQTFVQQVLILLAHACTMPKNIKESCTLFEAASKHFSFERSCHKRGYNNATQNDFR